jgi:nitroreductase
MGVKEAISLRRAYRSLDPVPISDELIKDLAECASLSPSCFNNQPWRFVFVRDPEVLKEMHGALSMNNDWVRDASMIIAVFSRKEDDCVIRDREYHLFDVGMATAFIILRATELGLVAHPIAGYSPKKVKATLGIPEDRQVITLVNVGRHSETLRDTLTGEQKAQEKERPQRLSFDQFAYIDRYKETGS